MALTVIGNTFAAIMRWGGRNRWLFRMVCAYLGATASSGVYADVISYDCTPAEVAVWDARVHVRCAAASVDGGANIWYFAVPHL